MKQLTKLFRTCFEFLFCTAVISINSRGVITMRIDYPLGLKSRDATVPWRCVTYTVNGTVSSFSPPTLHTVIYATNNSPDRLLTPRAGYQQNQKALQVA